MLTILMDSCLKKTGLDLSFGTEANLPYRVPLEWEFIPLNQCVAHQTNQFVYHHYFIICSVENLKKKKKRQFSGLSLQLYSSTLKKNIKNLPSI